MARSSSSIVRLVRLVVLILGLYEFLSFYKLWRGEGETEGETEGEGQSVRGNLLYSLRDWREKTLYSAYILSLGLQRLTFLTSSSPSPSHYNYRRALTWVCLIATHVVEAALWWAGALLKFNLPVYVYVRASGEGVGESLVRAAASSIATIRMILFEHASQPDEYVLLVGVPVLCVLFTIAAVVDFFSSESIRTTAKKSN